MFQTFHVSYKIYFSFSRRYAKLTFQAWNSSISWERCKVAPALSLIKAILADAQVLTVDLYNNVSLLKGVN